MKAPLGYIFSRFPLLSETFLLRQVMELERAGWPIELYSLQHERGRVRHRDAALRERTVQFLEFASRRTIGANARLFWRSPQLYTHLLGRVIKGNLSSVDFLTKGIALFPGVVGLAEHLRRRGVRHIHGVYGTHPALAGMLASELLDVDYSFTVRGHDLHVDTTMLAEKVRRARFVIAVCEYNRQRLREIAGPIVDEKTEVIRSGLDLSTYRFRPPAEHVGVQRILAIGSLQEYKGHAYLIQACALLRAAHPARRFVCDIVGEGHLRPRLDRLIAELQLGNDVRVLGPMDQVEVRHRLESADLLVLPSIVARNRQVEGLPNALIEAMAVGTPVVATDVAGVPELVVHGSTGLLVPQKDPLALRDAVLECWRTPQDAARRAERGRELVERNHDLTKNVARLSELFEQALTVTGPRPGRRVGVGAGVHA